VDIRGRGLMSALEFGGRDGSLHAESGTAAKLVRAAGERGLMILAAGTSYALPLAFITFGLRPQLSAQAQDHSCPADVDMWCSTHRHIPSDRARKPDVR